MISYIIRRLLLIIPTVLGITFLIFMLVAYSPGGVGAALQASSGQMEQSDRARQEAYLEERYGLNDPPVVQYLRWLGRVSPIKFGTREQVKPNGEAVRPPKALATPVMAGEWYGMGSVPTEPAPPEHEFNDVDLVAPGAATPEALGRAARSSIVRWVVDDNSPVRGGQVVAEITQEGSTQPPIAVTAPRGGTVRQSVPQGTLLPASGVIGRLLEDRDEAYRRAADRYARSRAAFIGARAQLEDAIRLYATWGGDRLRGHNDAVRRLRERRQLLDDPGAMPADQRAELQAEVAELESRLLTPEQIEVSQAHADRYRGAVDRGNDLGAGVLRRAGFDAGHELAGEVVAAGDAALAAYGAAQHDRSALIGLYRARPFRQAGFWIIPGLVSVASPDLGVSFSRGTSVLTLIKQRLPVTLTLNLIAFPIIYLLAIPTGLLSAVQKGRFFDHAVGGLVVAMWSIPVLVSSVLMVGFLANRNQFLGENHFPTGFTPPGHETMAFLPDRGEGGEFRPGLLLSQIHHMLLPLIALVYPQLAILSKQTRASMLDNFSADYVRTAKAKGVSQSHVVSRHVMRNSLLPLITMFATIFPAMLGGSIIVEKVFDIDGMGSLILEAINLRDRELLLANIMMITCVNLLALLLADILYAVADPRISYS